MSTVRLHPSRWFEDVNWRSVQVVGRLRDEKSIYLRIAFRPYFTVRYDQLDPQLVQDHHDYLLSETPVVNIVQLQPDLYRMYVVDKDDYYNGLNFYKKNGLGTILDSDQDVKSKFFTERRIDPGSWQEASDLRSLLHNVNRGRKYSSADLEYYTNNIRSVQITDPPPVGVNVFFDIEVVPSDDVSFPEARNVDPPDSITSISMVVQASGVDRSVVYMLTDRPVQSTDVRSFSTERELLQNFFNALAEIRPDRLITMNGRHFDINYIGLRVKALGMTLPAFSKINGFTPYFYTTTIVQSVPFPSREQVMALSVPGISQIDLLDYFRRVYPQFGSHSLETVSQILLGRGKVDLPIPELIAKYRRGTPEDLAEIARYSLEDSVLLRDLWIRTQIPVRLLEMANFWKADPEWLITHQKGELFHDWLRYLSPDVPEKRWDPGSPPIIERKPGIHRNVYHYSLSEVYLTALEQLQDPVATAVVDYFRENNSNDGIVAFRSGYFPVKFNDVLEFVKTNVKPESVVWLEENSLALSSEFPYLNLIERIPLVVVIQKSWILVSASGVVFKKGMSAMVRPPFRLIQRYVDYLIDFLRQNPGVQVVFPDFPTTLEDFVLDTKVTSEDYSRPGKKEEIVTQLRELGLPITKTWRRVHYIQTSIGPILEEVYSKDPGKWSAALDLDFYNQKLQSVLQPILRGK